MGDFIYDPSDELKNRRQDLVMVDKLAKYETAMVELGAKLRTLLPELRGALRAAQVAEPDLEEFHDDYLDEVGFLDFAIDELVDWEAIRDVIKATKKIAGGTERWKRMTERRIKELERTVWDRS